MVFLLSLVVFNAVMLALWPGMRSASKNSKLKKAFIIGSPFAWWFIVNIIIGEVEVSYAMRHEGFDGFWTDFYGFWTPN